ncbi:Bcr/CflA family multidrug efflux MFS transporter [Prauserella cavernicola]|uniref:Bcr/CflA family multidrug efflux MFS transporter n=1 Tax=Prauserella cavernicola TaxID=2800127 RepID=A0A934QQT5_9PSEU|nr:Bcr/CflA family multidrug efflux MFS transporter [Prauserella cavernicola]MBK1786517.1 Bcr/CflA family multidrug efflux MFS transporter [Prauserella cavernicola]
MSTETATRPASPPQTRRTRTARYALVLGGLTAFGPLSIDMYLPALPAMAGDLRTGDATLQLTLAAFVLGVGIGQLVLGPLSDAYGRRKPLLAGVAVFVVASVLCVVSPSVELLIAARVLQAFGAAAGMVISRAAVRDLFSGIAMARFFSMLMLVTGLAPILAPVLGGQLLALTSWRGIFGALAAFGALLLVVAAFALPETLPEHRRRPANPRAIVRGYARLLRDRVFVGYGLGLGLSFAAMFTYISASSFVLQTTYGLDPQEYGFVFGTGAVGLVLAGQVNGRLVGRVRQRTLLFVGLTGNAAGSFAVLVAALSGLGLEAVLPALFVAVASAGLVMPNATSLALNDHPEMAGSASALLGVLQFTVGGLTSPLAGLSGEKSALPMAMLMTLFGLLALVSVGVLARRRSSDQLPQVGLA